MLARCEPWQRRRTDDEVISSPSSHTGTRSGDRQGCLSPPPLITYMASLQLSAGLGAVLTTRHHHSDCVSTGAVDPSSPQPTPLTRLFLEAPSGALAKMWSLSTPGPLFSAVLPVTNGNGPIDTQLRPGFSSCMVGWDLSPGGSPVPQLTWGSHLPCCASQTGRLAQPFALIKGLALRAGQTPRALPRHTPGFLPASVSLILQPQLLQLLVTMMRNPASRWCRAAWKLELRAFMT